MKRHKLVTYMALTPSPALVHRIARLSTCHHGPHVVGLALRVGRRGRLHVVLLEPLVDRSLRRGFE